MAVVMLCTTLITAQSILTGTVIDSGSNMSLPGANIIEKGTDNGVSSNFDGEFTLTTKSTSGQIIISYVGYTSVTVSFSGDTSLGNIILTSDNSLE